MKRMKKLWACLLALTLLAGCAAAPAEDESLFTDRDLQQDYDKSKAVVLQLSGDQILSDAGGVTVNGTTATITEKGVYLLTGTLRGGQIIVDAPEDAKVQLVLSGASIHCEASAAIYVRQADKVFLTLDAETENTLSCGESLEAIDENNVDAAVFSKETLTINGAGTLTVTAPGGHGVVSKGKLKITGGSISITAASHGLTGKNGVYIADGTLTVVAGKDGLRAENDKDAARGAVYVGGGSIAVTSAGDGLYAGGDMEITGGSFTIVTGGGSHNAATRQDERMARGGRFGRWETTADTQSTASTKGLKAAGGMTLHGGSFALDCMDDAIHGGADITISGGTYQIATGDDGVHADGNVVITGGTIVVSKSYEGIEGQRIEISGGDMDLTSSDDGLNAAGDGEESDGAQWFSSPFEPNANNEILISGGRILIDAGGDGVDSNGNLTVSGGEIYISGPESSGDGALDFNGEGVVTGGTVIALGASGMAQNFGSASTQGAMLVSCGTQAAGTVVSLTNAAGTELLSWTARKRFSSVVISMAAIEDGETYTLKIGDTEQQITMNGLIYGSGFGDGFGGRGGFGGFGDQRFRDRQNSQTDGTPPEKPDGTPPADRNFGNDLGGFTPPEKPDGTPPASSERQS